MTATDEPMFFIKIMDLKGRFEGYLTREGYLQRNKTHKAVSPTTKADADKKVSQINAYGKFTAKAVKK